MDHEGVKRDGSRKRVLSITLIMISYKVEQWFGLPNVTQFCCKIDLDENNW